MCRLAAFPPGFKRDEAIDILTDMERCNTDGTGYAFLHKGQFVIKKSPVALKDILAKDKDSFLNHMPYYDGWTIAHLRAASHGDNTMNNTHPFNINDKWCVAHNGIWSEYNVVKLALRKQIKFQGETDSEVAAHLLNIAGPKNFSFEVSHGGVFLALKKNGELWAIKTSGDLEYIKPRNNPYCLSSEFPIEKMNKTKTFQEGWFQFDKYGNLIDLEEYEEVTPSYSSYIPKTSFTEYFGGSSVPINDKDDEGCWVKSSASPFVKGTPFSSCE